MKKKIFLGILIAIATICLFAVSVSAAVTIDDIQYDLSSKDNGNFATVSAANRGTCNIETVIIPETVEYDGKTYTVNKIADYAFAENSGIVNLVILPKLTRIPNSLVQASTSVKKVYVDFSNVTEIGSRALTFATRDDSKPVEGQEFKLYTPESYFAGEDVEITEIDLPNVTSIGSGAFNNSSIKKVTIGKNCTSIGVQTFRYSDIEEVTVLSNADIPSYFCGSTTNLKKIRLGSPTSIGGSAFSGCTNVTEIRVDMSRVTTVNGNSFCFSSQYDGGNTTTQWYNLNGEKVVDLSSLTTLNGGGNSKSGTFASSNLGSAKIIWPKEITTLTDQAFRKCNITGVMYINAAEDVTLTMTRWAFDGNAPSVVICGKGVTTISNFFEAQCTVVCLADSVEFTQSDPFKKSDNTIYCKDYTANNAGNITSKATVNTISSGTATTFKGCGAVVDLVLADGTPLKLDYVEHSHEASPDNTVCPAGSVMIYKCAGCGDTYRIVDEETYISDTHEFDIADGATIVSIVYANGNYLAKGAITKKCANCDAEITPDIEEECFEPLFDDLGYSMEENSSNVKSISQTVSINKKALEFYESLMQVKINYGVVAAIANDDTAPLSVVDGKVVASTNAVSVNMTDTDYSKVVLKLNGVSTSVAVNCSGYLMVDGVVSYISGDELTDKPIALTYVDAVVSETPVEDEE